MKIDAILPAGGRIDGSFAEEAGAEIKALIEIGGRTVLERTIDTLRSCDCVERIVVIGPDELSSHPAVTRADAVLPELDSGPENILRGVSWLHDSNGGRHADRVLSITTDLPFLSPETVTAFVDACPPESEICLPLISREEFEARFPGSTNFYVRLRDGEWTIGCTFLVDPAAIEANRELVNRVFRARKSQVGMARLLGFLFIARLLTRRLTVAHIEQRCRQLLGCSGCGVRGCAPELAFDIDYAEEYRYALSHAAHDTEAPA